MSLAFGVVVALLLLVVPGTLIALAGRLPAAAAIAVGPALTYGVIGLAIIPFGALGIPWNLGTAIVCLAAAAGLAACLPALLARFHDRDTAIASAAQPGAAGRRHITADASSAQPGAAGRHRLVTWIVGAGVALGALLIFWAAFRGMPQWQSIPSTWDSVWHANTIRWILDTGQASSTHMGELRNVETHAELYYPSTFHALAALQCQLLGTAPTTAFTLHALAASIWLFPVSAAVLAWAWARSRVSELRAAGMAATAAALSASFTAVPYVEFDVAAVPNLVAYGLAVPTVVLIMSCLRHRDRIPLAVLAMVGVFSTHTTGGIVVVTFVGAWWLCDTLWHPIRSRRGDFLTLLTIAIASVLLLLPQFLSLLGHLDVIVGHQFATHQPRLRVLFNAVVQHTRHLNDFPIQNILIALAGAGGLLLLIKRIWWPAVVWALLMASIVHSGAPFGGPLGVITAKYSDLFYSDPRRLSAVVTLLLVPMAGIALFVAVQLVVAGLTRAWPKGRAGLSRRTQAGLTAALLVLSTVGLAWYYFPRHKLLMGQKYDRIMIDQKDLDAFAYLATLPGAKDTLIGDANTDGTAWMYAVSGLHPLWTHYDYPVQQGPGYQRFIFWAYADDADHDPRIAEAVKALNIRYVLVSKPVVLGFKMPDGLVSLDDSASWAKIYDNGGARIYEWRG